MGYKMRDCGAVAADPEQAVHERYSRAAAKVEPSLCCATQYDIALLKALPDEVIERDYGCGDPTRYVRKGETVLDLGSGTGKICFMASQIVGPNGRVIGIDMNDEMLGVARRAAPQVAGAIGYGNVEFKKARIQDLQLDHERLQKSLVPGMSESDVRATQDRLRKEQPLVKTASVDVIVSNCVLNLVRSEDKKQLFAEMARVLKDGGRAVISDIVSDKDVPKKMQQDPDLWSGCISGAFREDAFVQAFADAGLVGSSIVERPEEPWQTVNGIEFRSVTVTAYKGRAPDAPGPTRQGCC